jgi:hypothetical protein
MSGFPGKPQIAFSPGFTAPPGTCRTEDPGQEDFLQIRDLKKTGFRDDDDWVKIPGGQRTV